MTRLEKSRFTSCQYFCRHQSMSNLCLFREELVGRSTFCRSSAVTITNNATNIKVGLCTWYKTYISKIVNSLFLNTHCYNLACNHTENYFIEKIVRLHKFQIRSISIICHKLINGLQNYLEDLGANTDDFTVAIYKHQDWCLQM